MTKEEETSEKSGVLSINSLVGAYILLCYISFSTATSACYVYYTLLNPNKIYITGGPLINVLIIISGLFIGYLTLLFGSWVVSKVAFFIVTRGKPVPEGSFTKDDHPEAWNYFALRHVVVKFSMWVFKKLTPHWLYRRYVGTFIKVGKNVFLPEWTPMELCEIGDNTVFAREIGMTSHFVTAKRLTFQKIKIGKNCIFDSIDNTKVVGIGPGVVVEDNVIVKAGTVLTKGKVLEENGIYEGNIMVKRVGNISDMPKEELERFRKEVRKKRKFNSQILKDWSSFASRTPRILRNFSYFLGSISAIALVLLNVYLIMPALINNLGILGHVLNLFILPLFVLLAYAFQVYIPVFILYAIVMRYEKDIPQLPDEEGASIVVTDPDAIEKWKEYKWLKWQAIDIARKSAFPETITLVYKLFGNDGIAWNSMFYESIVDPDHVSVGENTLFSADAHVYGYILEEDPEPKLTLKRTYIGSDCVIGNSSVMAGARIENHVSLGLLSVVPPDKVLKENKTYFGNPVMEQGEFLKMFKQRKSKE